MIENDLSIFEFDKNTTREVAFEKLQNGLKALLSSFEREAVLSTENALLKVKLFGKSSEKRKKPKGPDSEVNLNANPDLNAHVFDEAKATPDDLTNDEAIAVATGTLDESAKAITVKTPKTVKIPKIRKPIPAGYPRVEVIHDLNEDQKVCSCGCQMTSFGGVVAQKKIKAHSPHFS